MLHRIVKKAGPELHIFLNSVVLLTCVLLVAMVGYLLLKHFALKSSVYNFVYQGQLATKLRYLGAASTEDAQIVATTIGQVPSDKPLYTNKAELQAYVTTLAKQTNRDVVVLDTKNVILADSTPANVGKIYQDGGDSVKETLQDGMPRRFTKQPADDKEEVDEVVVPVMSSEHKIVGELILSVSHVFDN